MPQAHHPRSFPTSFLAALVLSWSSLAAGPARAQRPAMTPEVAQSWNQVVRLTRTAAEQRKAGQLDAALKTVDQAAETAQKVPEGAGPLWLAIAAAYHQLDAVTLAEGALKKAGSSPQVEATRTNLTLERRHDGLFPAAGIAPEAEPGYVRTFDHLSAALAQKKLVRAELEA